MRMPDVVEALIASGAVVTVVGMVGAILFRVMRGGGEADRLEKLKNELDRARLQKDAGQDKK